MTDIAAACGHTAHRVNDRGEDQGQIARTAWEPCAPAAKPAYRDRYPCAACRTGYLDCAAAALTSLRCCKDCDGHRERFVRGAAAYTEDEYDDMWKRYLAPSDRRA